MLGEQIGEFRGKRSGIRVLSVEGGFKGEATVEDAGTLLGIAATQIVTGCATMRPDGSLYGESQALVLGSDGSSATWKGLSVVKFLAGGVLSSRGAVSFSTASPKWARLNSVVAIFELEEDAERNTHSKFWEWK